MTIAAMTAFLVALAPFVLLVLCMCTVCLIAGYVLGRGS
jgi:hypothetical protein